MVGKVTSEVVGKEGGMKAPFRFNMGPDQMKALQDSGMSPPEFINQAILEKAGKDSMNDMLLDALKTNNKVSANNIPNMNPGGSTNSSKFGRMKDMMAEMMEMTMMEKMMEKMFGDKNANEDVFEKIFKMKQLQSMMNDSSVDTGSKNQLSDMMKTEINGLKKDMDDSKRWEKIVEALKSKNDDNSLGVADLMKVYGNRDEKMEKYRVDAETARSESMHTNLQSQINRMTDLMATPQASETSKLKELSESVKLIKDISSNLTGEKKVTKSDTVKDLLNTAMPVLKPLADAAGHSMMGGGGYGPEPSQPIHVQPVPSHHEPINKASEPDFDVSMGTGTDGPELSFEGDNTDTSRFINLN